MKNRTQAAPVAASACNVIRLPTAAAEPVVNPKRKGRPPRNVTTVGELLYRRRLKQEAAQERAEEALFDAKSALHTRVLSLISGSTPARLKQIESALLAHNLPLGG